MTLIFFLIVSTPLSSEPFKLSISHFNVLAIILAVVVLPVPGLALVNKNDGIVDGSFK